MLFYYDNVVLQDVVTKPEAEGMVWRQDFHMCMQPSYPACPKTLS